MNPARQIHSGSAVEIKPSTGKTERRPIEQVGRKNVSFAQAYDLLSQEDIHEAVRIIRGRMSLAVIHRVNAGKRILVGEALIKSCGSEIFANRLQRIAESFSN